MCGEEFVAAVGTLVRTSPPVQQMARDVQLGNDFIRGARILVIDDSPAFLNSFELFLTDGGFQVTTAESGEQAIQLLKSN